jgi:hypothetical protein
MDFDLTDRQSFADYEYLATDKILPTVERIPAATHERGWKDVAQFPPYTITRIIIFRDSRVVMCGTATSLNMRRMT